jgi:hypothetical protein
MPSEGQSTLGDQAKVSAAEQQASAERGSGCHREELGAAAGDHDGLGLLVAGQPIRDPQCRTGPSRSTRTSSVVGGTAMPPH